LIADAQRSGQIPRNLDAKSCAGAVFALLNSIIWWRRPGSRPTIEELTSTYQRLLLNGLSTSGG
jgi:hypothetical protein